MAVTGRKSATTALLAVLFLASCNGTSFLLQRRYENHMPPVPAGEMPPAFPIIVVTGEAEQQRAFVLKATDLDAFRRANPEFRYLIPPGRAAALNTGLTIWNPRRHDLVFAMQSFEMEAIADGRQRIRANIRSRGADADDDVWVNRSVYEAADAYITPLQHHSYSAERANAGMTISALLINMVVFLVLGVGYKIYRRAHS